jgi:hypothetical protein
MSQRSDHQGFRAGLLCLFQMQAPRHSYAITRWLN